MKILPIDIGMAGWVMQRGQHRFFLVFSCPPQHCPFRRQAGVTFFAKKKSKTKKLLLAKSQMFGTMKEISQLAKKIIMRNLVITTILSLYSIAIFAQVPDHALGVRFGGTVNAWGAEASYQIGVSDETRLELDLGLGTNKGLTVFKGTGGYHWIGNLGGDFNWFGGPVLASGMYRLDNPNKEGEKYEPFFHVGVVLGIDYFFDKEPFQIAVDFRPEYPIGDSYADGDLDTGLGVSVRYIIEW